MPHKHRCCTAASAASGMSILLFGIVDEHPAVLMLAGEIHVLLAGKLKKNFLAYTSQITGEDGIVVRRFPVEISKVLRDGLLNYHPYIILKY